MNANQPIDAPSDAGRRGKPRTRGAGAPSEAGRARRRAPSRRRPPLPVADGRVAEVMSAVARRIGERPVTSIAAAAAIGFAVGGALRLRVGRMLLQMAARQLGREVIKQLL